MQERLQKQGVAPTSRPFDDVWVGLAWLIGVVLVSAGSLSLAQATGGAVLT